MSEVFDSCLSRSPLTPERRSDRLSVVKIDTEKYPALATRYKVSGLPTVVLFKKGEPVDRIEGLPQKEQLIQRLQYFLGA